MNMFYENQMNLMVQPMREELTRNGFIELKSPEEVDEAFQKKGVALVVVNSVCGCAAGLARPAAVASLQYEFKPDHVYTVFAGQDKEATEQARKYFTDQPPSSPSFALLKDGNLVGMVHRYEIEGSEPQEILNKLVDLYDEHCRPEQ